MIIYKDKSALYFSVMEGNEEEVYIVEDSSALGKKIQANFPYLELVTENGVLSDVTPFPHTPPDPPPTTEERLSAVEAALLEVILNG